MVDIAALPPQEGNPQSLDSAAATPVESQTSQVALALIDALACWAMPVKETYSSFTTFGQNLGQKTGIDSTSSLLTRSLQHKTSHADSSTATTATISRTTFHPSSTVTVLSPLTYFHQHASSLQRTSPHPIALPGDTQSQSLYSTKHASQLSHPPATVAPRYGHESVVQSKQSLTQPLERTRHATEALPIPIPLRLEKRHVTLSLQQPTQWQRQDQEESSQHRKWQSQEQGTSSKSPVKKVACVASAHFATHVPPKPKDNSVLMDVLKQPAELLSEALGTRMSYFDVLTLFFELMKLEIDSQEDEKLARRTERQAQLKLLDKEVSNFKAQAKWMLFSYVGAGVLGIASGMAPIVGHMKGEGILNTLSSVFSSLQGAKKKDFFDGISKMTYAMSEMQKATGQIYSTSAEGDRTRYNRLGDLHRNDQDEITRGIEQLQERLRQSERFLVDLLQMRHDVTSQLYR